MGNLKDLSTPLVQHMDLTEKPTKKNFARFFTGRHLTTFAWLMAVIVFGTLNNVAKKVMSVPMGDRYQYFLANTTAVAYVVFYGAVLATRYCTGSVSTSMLKYKKWPLAVSGLMDGLGNIMGTIATPHLSGAIMPLLAQSILPFSMVSSVVLLRQMFSVAQLAGASLVIAGALVSLIPQLSNFGSETGYLAFAALFALSTLPNALSFSVKELYFKSYKAKVDHRGLDIFVVSFFGSLFQLMWTVLFYPVVAMPGLGGVPFSELPELFANGMKCMVGVVEPAPGDNCAGNPWPIVVYIVLNLSFNISLLVLLKRGGALLMFIGIKACVPFTAVLFYFDWPGVPSKGLSGWVLVAMALILVGLFIYRISSIVKEERDERKRNFDLALLASLTSDKEVDYPDLVYDSHNLAPVPAGTGAKAGSV